MVNGTEHFASELPKQLFKRADCRYCSRREVALLECSKPFVLYARSSSFTVFDNCKLLRSRTLLSSIRNTSSTKTTYDFVIVGGGVIGSSVAYWLRTMQAGSVAVVERDPSYSTCSSALSAASIRTQFSTPECIQMSVFGANFIKNVDKHLSVDGQAPALSFREGGYLFLAANDKAMFENTVLQKEHGANVALLNPQQLKERFPWLHTDDITCGSLGLSNEGTGLIFITACEKLTSAGWLDAYALLQGFKTKARALGADYIRADVTALQREKNRISGVQLDTGSVLKAGHVINAAGPRAGDLAALVGYIQPLH